MEGGRLRGRRPWWGWVVAGAAIVAALAILTATLVIPPTGSYEVISAANLPRLKIVAELDQQDGALLALAWSPDSSRLATGSEDGTVIVWRTSDWTKESEMSFNNYGVWALAWSPDGDRLACSGVSDHVAIYDPFTGHLLEELGVHSLWVLCLDWSPNGSALAAGDFNGNVTVWNTTDWTETAWVGDGVYSVFCVRWSPDGGMLASGGLDYVLRVWNATSWEQMMALTSDSTVRNDINGALWLGSDRIVAAGQDGFVRIWNLTTRTEVLRLHQGEGWVKWMALSEDGQVLFFGGENKNASAWEFRTGALLEVLQGPTDPVWSLALSPDGRMLAMGSGSAGSDSGDNRVRIWAVEG